MRINENLTSGSIPEKPSADAVAIYLRYYLPIPMNFVYRQLQGVAARFRPIVLASSSFNLDVFPHESIFVHHRSVLERTQSRIARLTRRKYAVLAGSHRRYLGRVLRENDVKLIHAHFGPYAMEILPVAREIGIPLLATFHGFGASVLLRNSRYLSQLRDLFDYAHVLAASRATAERLLKVGAHTDRISVHYIGVPQDLFAYVPRTPPAAKLREGMTIRFLQVSSFVEVKGHRYTLQAFAELLKSYPNCDLTLAGEGPTRREMEAKCISLGIADRVHFVGRITPEGVATLLKDSDIFLHHSVTPPRGDTEAATTAVGEAMSTGLVVIGTNHGGIPEMIDHGVNGFLVEERDIAGYVRSLREALACTEQIGRKASEKIVSEFNLQTQNQKLMDIYDDAIGRHR